MIIISSCASKKYKNVAYLKPNNTSEKQPTLNVFVPRNKKSIKNPVLLFVHGGNWNSGDKKMYGFFGRNFAKKGITTVIVGYSLSPESNYDAMAKQVAEAVQWTKNNISTYKGDPESLYLTGHSAGGHLIALVVTNPKYLKDANIIKGVILNDAAGLDINHYLEGNPPTAQDDYVKTWSENPENWKDASPIFFLTEKTPRFMIYTGSKTYNSIKITNARFLEKLKPFQPNVQTILLNKKHVPMMTQYIFPWNKRYDEIKAFIKRK